MTYKCKYTLGVQETGKEERETIREKGSKEGERKREKRE